MGRWLVQTDDQLIARVKSRCIVTPSGCWEYQGNRNHMGYGQASFRNQKWMVHRFMYWTAIGRFPLTLEIQHKCDNPPCCNPEHLEPGTHKQNLAEALAKGRHYYASLTHCKRGHPLSGDNLYINSSGSRDCKACQRARERIANGWPKDLAYSMPVTPHGRRPVNAKKKREQKGRRLKTVCIHGHALTGHNLYITSEGRRRCRACHHEHVRRVIRKRQSSQVSAPAEHTK